MKTEAMMSKDGQLNDYLRALDNGPEYTPPEGYKVHSQKAIEKDGHELIRAVLWRRGWNKKGGHRDELVIIRELTAHEVAIRPIFKPHPLLKALASGRKIKITHGI